MKKSGVVFSSESLIIVNGISAIIGRVPSFADPSTVIWNDANDEDTILVRYSPKSDIYWKKRKFNHVQSWALVGLAYSFDLKIKKS